MHFGNELRAQISVVYQIRRPFMECTYLTVCSALSAYLEERDRERAPPFSPEYQCTFCVLASCFSRYPTPLVCGHRFRGHPLSAFCLERSAANYKKESSITLLTSIKKFLAKKEEIEMSYPTAPPATNKRSVTSFLSVTAEAQYCHKEKKNINCDYRFFGFYVYCRDVFLSLEKVGETENGPLSNFFLPFFPPAFN